MELFIIYELLFVATF